MNAHAPLAIERPALPASTRIANVEARYGKGFSPRRLDNDPVAAALYWSRRRRDAYRECQGWGWGRLPEWDTPESRQAYDDLEEARTEMHAIFASYADRRSTRALTYSPVLTPDGGIKTMEEARG